MVKIKKKLSSRLTAREGIAWCKAVPKSVPVASSSIVFDSELSSLSFGVQMIIQPVLLVLGLCTLCAYQELSFKVFSLVALLIQAKQFQGSLLSFLNGPLLLAFLSIMMLADFKPDIKIGIIFKNEELFCYAKKKKNTSWNHFTAYRFKMF